MSKDKDQDFDEVLDLFEKLSNPTLKGTLTFTYTFELNGKSYTVTKSVENPYKGWWADSREEMAQIVREFYSADRLLEDIDLEQDLLVIFREHVKEACDKFDGWEKKYRDSFWSYFALPRDDK
jgi:hypothetical protein